MKTLQLIRKSRGTAFGVLTVTFLFASAATAEVWPTDGWSTATPAQMGMNEAKLRQARDYALTGGGSGMIVRGGYLVYSWGNQDKRYDLKSSTKSIGGSALGLAIGDGFVALSDFAQQYLPTIAVPPNGNAATGWPDDITISQLATHTAGFDKPGGYANLLFQPGTTWSYTDAGPNWLADLLTVVYHQDLQTLLFARVFSHLGIDSNDLRWRLHGYREQTINGVTRRELGSGISANVDAMGRIGYLYLRNGTWNGLPILPQGFVQQVRTPRSEVVGLPVNVEANYPSASDHYGVLWWTNADGALPSVPRDAFWSWGLMGSFIIVIPSLDIVAARAGNTLGNLPGINYGTIAPFITPLAESVNTAAPVSVPNVVGLTQAAAATAITNAGLVVGAVTQQSSATVPAGSVISQNPTAGTGVADGSAVNLVVSTGPASVSVPNVVGLTQAAAATAITNAGLVVGAVTQQSSATVPAGSVISQNPTAGTGVADGSAVNLVVSTGPASVSVPNVVGLTQAAAATAITNAGLVVGAVTQQSSATVPAGSVISQNPTAGTGVADGSAVNLVVSTGPASVSVPNVVGLTQAAAATAITNAGLVVGAVTQQSSATVPAGSVISQNPTAGTGVADGSAVNLVVSSGSAPAVVTESYLRFDGQNDVVTSGDVDLPSQMTVEAWIRPTTVSNVKLQDRVVSKDVNLELMVSTADTGCSFGSNGHVQWRLTINGKNVRLCGGTLTLNVWQHVVGTFNGSTLRLYINGQLVASAMRSGVLTTNNDALTIGNTSNLDRPFDGGIEEVRLWARMRSQAEILADMNSELSGLEAGLVAYYRFNESAGQVISDASASGRHAVRGRTAASETSDPEWVVSN